MIYKPKYKLFKTATVEVAAICNVACLVFCFFMITSKFKAMEPTPMDFVCRYGYHPPRPIVTIMVIGDKVELDLPSKLREVTLTTMANKYGVSILPYQQFLIEANGIVDFSISKSKNQINQGIPTGPNNSELYKWIYSSRLSTRAICSSDARIIIKKERIASADLILRIAGILKEQHLNNVQIITSDDDTIALKL